MTKKLKLSMIVAVDSDNGIGKNNRMPWHISEDLKRFKNLTTGHPIVMGRKTWESLPKKPLPQRNNIIITRNTKYKAEGATVIHTIEALQQLSLNNEIFIIGGAEIYKLFYTEITKLYLTNVKKSYNCDTFLNFFNINDWEKSFESEKQTDSKTNVAYQFLNLIRKK